MSRLGLVWSCKHEKPPWQSVADDDASTKDALWNELITVFFGYYFSKSSASVVLLFTVSHTAGALSVWNGLRARAREIPLHCCSNSRRRCEEGDTQPNTHRGYSVSDDIYVMFIFDFVFNRFVNTRRHGKVEGTWQRRDRRRRHRRKRHFLTCARARNDQKRVGRARCCNGITLQRMDGINRRARFFYMYRPLPGTVRFFVSLFFLVFRNRNRKCA